MFYILAKPDICKLCWGEITVVEGLSSVARDIFWQLPALKVQSSLAVGCERYFRCITEATASYASNYPLYYCFIILCHICSSYLLF